MDSKLLLLSNRRLKIKIIVLYWLIWKKFLGLAIDEVNQSDLTDERVEKWTEEIKKAL